VSSIGVYDDIGQIVIIHGHGGKTRIEFLD
jgi:hypothetical protein